MTDLSVRRLCQWIGSSPARQKTTLVIDGRPKPDEPSDSEFPDIHLVYSGAGITADTVIAQMLQRSANRKKVTVVSNDRAVQASARRVGAGYQSCEAFLSMLITAHSAARGIAQRALPITKTQGSPTKGETDHWLQEFGIDPKDVPEKPVKKPGDDEIDMKKLMGF